MKEQLISFETAKLAKEKGFKLQSNLFGYITKFYNHNTGTLLAYGRTGKTDLTKAYYAPTQSLLQKWLRDQYKIHINIRSLQCVFDNEINGYTMDIKSKFNTLDNDDTFATYEKALEIGLQEALKLI